MTARYPNLVGLGIALAAAYWLAESLLHTFVFDNGPLAATLLGEHDPNEVWMRLLISALFVAFGWVADRSVRAERRLKDDALRLNRLLRFVDQVKRGVQRRRGRTSFFPARRAVSAVAAHNVFNSRCRCRRSKR